MSSMDEYYDAEMIDRLTAAACENAELKAERDRLREALRECEHEIDCYIDDKFPVEAHPHFAKNNAELKAINPARVALQEVDGDTP